MMLSHLSDMLVLLLLALAAVFWWKTQQIKPHALQAATKRCEQEGLQLLDQSVVLRRVRFKRGTDGRLHACRRFRFEFSSTGVARYYGYVEVVGHRVASVSLDPHHI